MFTNIIVILASIGSVKNGTDSVIPITPRVRSNEFIGPLALNIVLIVSSETNCGIAIERTKVNLQKPLNLVPSLLITTARIIPNI